MAKSVLITGCSSGIGLHAAQGLRARGWRVIASARKAEDVTRLAEGGFDAVRLDYGDTDSVAQGFSDAMQITGGTLDALFNNAGHAMTGAVEDLPRDGMELVFASNVFGPQDLIRHVLPVMRAQGHGRIVQHSSVLGFVPMRWRGAYTATKHALDGMTKCLQIELRGTDIHASILHTGPVTSEFRKNSQKLFYEWIDWQNSVLADGYRRDIVGREDTGPDRFELPPDAVLAKVVHALEAKRPKPRYLITTPAYIAAACIRALPMRAQEWVASRI